MLDKHFHIVGLAQSILETILLSPPAPPSPSILIHGLLPKAFAAFSTSLSHLSCNISLSPTTFFAVAESVVQEFCDTICV